MAVFKCKQCGGTIEPQEGGIGVCDSCGTKQTIPNTNDEKKMNLLDRANHFRMQNEFDKAMGIYEQVLEEDTEDSDIYYAIALCRYGITYVDDPKTKKKIPTINRMQSKMFTKDADFMMAVEKAEPEQAKLYNEEGTYIDKVQTGILDITKNEKPYDVFICYKETDDNGKRTHDSVLANDLYYGLTNEGFKVFFARITLEGKLGTAYEPYIFSALNSSKVMVVLGTKKEYFNSVWVKNEWSRFLTFINNGEKKTLIPAYKDMDPYDLPDEFANLQAQDMSKLGFMQDLVRGIKKIVGGTKDELNNDIINATSQSVNGSNVNSLLKRAKMFLEDGDFTSANEYCEKVLDIDAENADAYLYKLLAEFQCSDVTKLKTLKKDLGELKNYKNAMRFAKDELKQTLIEANNEIIYNLAEDLYNKEKYELAENEYKKILGYKDSKEKYENSQNSIIYLKALSKGYYHPDEALDLFNRIPNFKDSKERANKLTNELKYKKSKDLFNRHRYNQALVALNGTLDTDDAKKLFVQIIDKLKLQNDDKYKKIYNSIKNEMPTNDTKGTENIFQYISKNKMGYLVYFIVSPFVFLLFLAILSIPLDGTPPSVNIFIEAIPKAYFPIDEYTPVWVNILAYLFLPVIVTVIEIIKMNFKKR